MLLQQAGVSRPNDKAISNCVRYMSSRLVVVDDVNMAKALYDEAKLIPGTTTRAVVKHEANVTVNGPLSDAFPSLLSGVTSTGQPVVIKVTSNAAEQAACQALSLPSFDCLEESCSNLVPCTVVDLDHVDAADSMTLRQSPCSLGALIMPRYVCSLAELPQLAPECIERGGRALQAALQYIHERSLVHMDVKAANVFLDARGSWRLGDFGSCVGVGCPITSYSAMFHPERLKTADVAYDIDLLVVLLVAETLKLDDKWKEVLYGESARSISAHQILLWSSREKVEHDGLNRLFDELRPGMSRAFSTIMGP